MAVVEVVISPAGLGSPSISKYVAACHKPLEAATDLKHMLTPMGTIIEGDLDRILEVIRQMHEVPFGEGAPRVSTLIRVDDRRDKKLTMEGKMKAVNEKLAGGK